MVEYNEISKINWAVRGYTEAEFISAWNSARNKGEVLSGLNLWGYGGNYNTLNRTAKILNLSDDHFDPKHIRRSIVAWNKIPTGQILVENSNISSISRLRKRLIAEGFKEEKCEICSLSEWMGGKIPLDLDHINGISNDNRIENLRIICKNCHGQTPTYGGKNKKSHKINIEAKKEAIARRGKIKNQKEIIRLSRTCSDCPSLIDPRSKGRCKPCTDKVLGEGTKASYPEINVIIENIETMGYEAYGRILGVSGNAVKKHLRNRDLTELPSRQKAKVTCFKCPDEAILGKKSCEAHQPRKENYPPIEDIITGVTELGWKKFADDNGINDYRNIIHHLKQRNIPLPSKDKI